MNPTAKGNTRKVKDCLLQILTGIQYNGEPCFTNVVDNTYDEFSGYPVARILPDKSNSTVQDSISWLHQDSYAVIVTWPLTDPSNVESDMYNASYDIADLVRNTLEYDDHISDLTQIDPTLIWNFALVPQTNWHVAQSKQGGAVLAVTMTVQINYSQTAV